ncbi:MAG: CHAP domain-containing protein [Mycoplasmatota bacterium]|nr:CHAP domain-containing protein [Mycoplasmatota bacterium]
MNVRTTKPTSGNKFFITKSKGGYSTCIQGSPTDSQCNVLANCVGYACGRFNEIIGAMKYPSLNCNAENFIERAKNTYGLEISSVPTLGGIMVWQKGTLSGNDGAGHVAIVEKIIDSNTIYTSESGYGGSAFWNSTRRNTNGRWGLGSAYTFRGCIVNPAIGKVVAPTPTPSAKKSVDEVAKEVIRGEWGNGDERYNRLTNAGYNYNEVQAKVNELLNSNKPTPAPTPSVDILDLVRKTIRGDFGNGEARRKALGSNYDEVQRQVNLNLKNGLTRWDNIKLF